MNKPPKFGRDPADESKPMVPMVLGTGPLADAMRAQIAADPDRYRPISFTSTPLYHCPCCDKDIYGVTNRYTNWVRGFSTSPTDEGLVHKSCNKDGEETPGGEFVACCCPLGAPGPMHDPNTGELLPPKKRKRKKKQ